VLTVAESRSFFSSLTNKMERNPMSDSGTGAASGSGSGGGSAAKQVDASQISVLQSLGQAASSGASGLASFFGIDAAEFTSNASDRPASGGGSGGGSAGGSGSGEGAAY
jgi:hypothetical protein